MSPRMVNLDRIATELGHALLRATLAEAERDEAIKERDELRALLESDPRRSVAVVQGEPMDGLPVVEAPGLLDLVKNGAEG